LAKNVEEIDNFGQFHKTFWGIIYANIVVLPYVLTQVMLPGAYITLKKSFMPLTPGCFE
jgi:hypothetical protein